MRAMPETHPPTQALSSKCGCALAAVDVRYFMTVCVYRTRLTSTVHSTSRERARIHRRSDAAPAAARVKRGNRGDRRAPTDRHTSVLQDARLLGLRRVSVRRVGGLEPFGLHGDELGVVALEAHQRHAIGGAQRDNLAGACLLYTSPSPRDS